MRYLLPIGLLALSSLATHAGQAPQLLELWNETVCYVNNERIAKRDVEREIDPMIMAKLHGFRYQMVKAGKWDQAAQSEYHKALMPDFRRELRKLVRQRLMLQEAKEKEIEIDKVKYQQRLDQRIQSLRQHGILGKPGFTLPEIKKQMREYMRVEEFSRSLVTSLDLPNKPQVEAYYKEHQSQYMLPPMIKLRIIKINMVREKKPGQIGSRKSPLKIAEDLRKDVVDYGINFADLAREKSDDEETRPHGGLILGPDGKHFIDPKQNSLLWPQVRRLDTGSLAERTSDVFQLGQSWAILFLEERRPAGPAPLDTALFEKIQGVLTKEVFKSKEKEWFGEALQRSLILDGSPVPKPIPLAFFFPEDPAFARELEKKNGKNKGNGSSKE